MSEEQQALVDLPKKRERKPGAGAKKKIKVTRFDLDAVRVLMIGKSLSDLCLELGVDSNEASRRLDELVVAGYLVKGDFGYKLGVEGYNKLGYKLLPKSKAQKQSQQGYEQEKHEEKIDLGEMLRLGAPKGKQMEAPPYVHTSVSPKREKALKQEEKPSEKAVEATIAPVEKASRECCELCKAAFKVGGKDSNPKYAHCVCGVAYHQDCYESLLENGGKCISCGKKLSAFLDKSGEDAVKGLKTVF